MNLPSIAVLSYHLGLIVAAEAATSSHIPCNVTSNVTSLLAPYYRNVTTGGAWVLPASSHDIGARAMTCECFDPEAAPFAKLTKSAVANTAAARERPVPATAKILAAAHMAKSAVPAPLQPASTNSPRVVATCQDGSPNPGSIRMVRLHDLGLQFPKHDFQNAFLVHHHDFYAERICETLDIDIDLVLLP
ncbi:MAG: hypothetical protein Q9182_002431 [Xanthomendoza sp. 2 TL-2023]